MAKRANAGWSKRLEKRINDEMPSIMMNAMTRVENEAKRIVYLGHPDHLNRQSGNLMRSITTEMEYEFMDDEFVVTTGSNMVYAPVHEFGSAYQTFRGVSWQYIPARPFLMPAWVATKDKVKSQFKKGIKRIIDEETI